MQSNLVRYSLGTKLYFKTKYGFGICNGFVVGLHDDFVKVQIQDKIVPVKFGDVLSIYDDD